MLQQVHLVVSMSVNKAMPQYLVASVAVNKTTTQQVSEGAVGNGKGRTRAGTPCVLCDCGCGSHHAAADTPLKRLWPTN